MHSHESVFIIIYFLIVAFRCLSCFISTPCFSILVNAASGVKRYQFAKVFWDYTEPTEGGWGDGMAQDGLVSEKSAALLRKLCLTSVGADHTAQVASTSQKVHNCYNKRPERAELLYRTCFLSTSTKCREQGKHAQVYVKNSRNVF